MATGHLNADPISGAIDLTERFDPFDAVQAADPFSIWKESVERKPVFYSKPLGAWIVTRHSIIQKILQDNKHFLNSGLNAMRDHPPEVQAILNEVRERAQPLRAIDEPEHMHRRRLSQSGVSPQRVSALEPKVRQIANELIDRFHAEKRCDFYERFAYRYPLAVISSLLGFPDEAADMLRHWANCRVALAWGNLELEKYKEVARGVVDFHKFIESEVMKRQAEPRDDMIGDFVRINAEAKQPVEMSEMIEQLHGLVTAGHESTGNWITLTLFHLLEDRRRWETVRSNPEGIPRMLEEALRFDGPVLGVWRRAGAGAAIEGIPIAESEKVYCVVGAGNRDPEVFKDPDSFAPQRDNLRQLITFGRGPHTCIGASLARLEGRVAFEVLTERLPSIRLAQDYLSFGENATLRMPQGLMVEWDA